jgi:hypothetical protein
MGSEYRPDTYQLSTGTRSTECWFTRGSRNGHASISGGIGCVSAPSDSGNIKCTTSSSHYWHGHCVRLGLGYILNRMPTPENGLTTRNDARRKPNPIQSRTSVHNWYSSGTADAYSLPASWSRQLEYVSSPTLYSQCEVPRNFAIPTSLRLSPSTPSSDRVKNLFAKRQGGCGSTERSYTS